jgi:hypothetical protein
MNRARYHTMICKLSYHFRFVLGLTLLTNEWSLKKQFNYLFLGLILFCFFVVDENGRNHKICF